jgi:glutamyl-tRNA reductase
MNILVLGLSHHTAPIEIREKLAFPVKDIPQSLIKFKQLTEINEAVILSTCNRVEIYAVSQTPLREVFNQIKLFLADTHQIPISQFEPFLEAHHGSGAARHLFRVASSLDSMVIGESQILGQVKEAYEIATSAGFTNQILHTLFQRSFGVAKEIRSTTDIGKGAISVGSVAVELAHKLFGDLHNRAVLVIGAGEMSDLTLRHLAEEGVTTITVSNRSYERAVELAQKYQGRAIRLEDCFTLMEQVDIVISSTGATQCIIQKEQLVPVMRNRKYRPIFLIDIAVPRDIDSQVNKIDNVYLYNIDDLQQVVDNNLTLRQQECSRCEALIEKELTQFMQWYNSLAITPIIKNLNAKLEGIRERELQRTLNQLADLSPEQKEKIAYLTQRITNQFLNSPLEQLKKYAATGDGFSHAQAINDLFELEKSNNGTQINADKQDNPDTTLNKQ